MAQRVEVVQVVYGLILLGANIAVLWRQEGRMSSGTRWSLGAALASFVVGALAVAVFASRSCTAMDPFWTLTLDLAGVVLFAATVATVWLGWLAPSEVV